MKSLKLFAWAIPFILLAGANAFASEADLKIPDLKKGSFDRLGGMSAWDLLFYGALVIIGTLGISLYQLWANSQTAGPQVDARRGRRSSSRRARRI